MTVMRRRTSGIARCVLLFRARFGHRFFAALGANEDRGGRDALPVIHSLCESLRDVSVVAKLETGEGRGIGGDEFCAHMTCHLTSQRLCVFFSMNGKLSVSECFDN